MGPRSAHPPGHSEKLHHPWSCEGQVPLEGRRLQEPGAFPPRPSWSSSCTCSMGAVCPHPGASPPTARRARPCWGHPDTSGSNCPWRAIGRELNIRQDGTNGMTGTESLLAQNGQTAVQRAVVIKHLDHSPLWTPQVAGKHEGTWGLRGCGDGETDAGAPRGPSGGRQHSQQLASPSATFLFLSGLTTAPVLPPPAI